MKKPVTPRRADDGMPQQRIVPAAGAPKPQTTGAPSVFGAAKNSRAYTRQNIDPESVPIISKVPVPPMVHTISVYSRLWARMKKGDHVELTDRQAHGLVAHAKKAGGKVAVRRLTDAKGAPREGIKGVWRLD